MGDVQGTDGPPPGWFVDPGTGRMLRWWDGGAWTNGIAPLDGPLPPPPPQRRPWWHTALQISGIVLMAIAIPVAVLALLFGACVAVLNGVA